MVLKTFSQTDTDNPTHIDVNLNALAHNLNIVKRHAPHSNILAMIKANAYGHGLIQVARTLTRADGFGVARLSEAKQLRQAGIQQKLVLMSGIMNARELILCAELNIDVVIHSTWQVDLITETTLKTPINVWLKIETGMHRLGIYKEQIEEVYHQLTHSNHVNQSIVLMTHFSDADNPQHLKTQKQFSTFQAITKNLHGLKSCANSGAIINHPETHLDWVRPGIMLFGASPVTNTTGIDFDLQPVMTLRSRIIKITQMNKGDDIGYGSTYRCPNEMTVGVVAIGYGDGYPRHLKPGTPVLINGKRCPIVGTVSMDMLSIDLSHVKASINDQVTLWGNQLPVEEIADNAHSISYELLTHMAARQPHMDEYSKKSST